MAVETVRALQIPDDSQEAEALNHFYRNGGPEQVCNFWHETSPMILEKIKQASTQEPALTEHELLTLAGGSFEGLALSWLKTQEESGGFRLVEIKFKKILELLSETKKHQ